MARYTQAQVQGLLCKMFPGAQAKVLALIFDALNDDVAAAEALITANGTSITNINAWANTLADTLNADAGVTGTTYDDNPQA